MYRMYGMPRAQGSAGAAHVQDVRYFAIEHMDVRCEACQSRTAHQLSHSKSKHHPAAATRRTCPLRHATSTSC